MRSTKITRYYLMRYTKRLSDNVHQMCSKLPEIMVW